MTASVLKFPLLFAFTEFRPLDRHIPKNHPSNSVKPSLSLKTPRFPRQVKARTTPMEAEQSGTAVNPSSNASMKLLFVEMGVGYDQHGCVKTLTLFSSFYSWAYFFLGIFDRYPSKISVFWSIQLLELCENKFDSLIAQYRQDITAAAMRACRDAISSNSIPAFRRGIWVITCMFLKFLSFLLFSCY